MLQHTEARVEAFEEDERGAAHLCVSIAGASASPSHDDAFTAAECLTTLAGSAPVHHAEHDAFTGAECFTTLARSQQCIDRPGHLGAIETVSVGLREGTNRDSVSDQLLPSPRSRGR